MKGMSRVLARFLVVVTGVLLVPAGAAGATELSEVAVSGGLAQPVALVSERDDPDRLLVAERSGTIQLVEGGTKTLFADLTSLVSCCAGDRGLTSLALAPDYASSGRLFVAYTGTTSAGGDEGDVHIDELEASGDSVDVDATRRPLLTIPYHGSVVRTAARLAFGPEGFLYIATGDGGDPASAQRSFGAEPFQGKILRIDPEPDGDSPYSAAQSAYDSNPFLLSDPRADELWSTGLKNPILTFDFRRGDLVVADGGEVNLDERLISTTGYNKARGANFGWPCKAGSATGPDGFGPPTCTDPLPALFPPTFERAGCGELIGGYVVRDNRIPELFGRYLYGDPCTGQLRSVGALSAGSSGDRAEDSLDVPGGQIAGLGEDSCGRVYVIGEDSIYRVQADLPTECSTAAVRLQELDDTFDEPVYVTSHESNPNRLYVVERAGAIQTYEEGVKTQVADLSSLVSCCEGERGLLSIDFATDFATTGNIYAYYTGSASVGTVGDVHVDRFTMVGGIVDPSTRREVISIPMFGVSVKVGGQVLVEDKMGTLLIGTGAGSAPDAGRESTGPDALRGKILRVAPVEEGSVTYLPYPQGLFAGPGDPRADEIMIPYDERVVGDPSNYYFDLGNVMRITYDELGDDLYFSNLRGDPYGNPLYSTYHWPRFEGSHQNEFGFATPDPDCGGRLLGGAAMVRDRGLGASMYNKILAFLPAPGGPGDPTDCTHSLGIRLSEEFAGTAAEFDLPDAGLYSMSMDACSRLYITTSSDGKIYQLTGPIPNVCRKLSLSVSGSVGGTIEGRGQNIVCADTCVTRMETPDPRHLIANPAPGYRFVGWSGDCSGTGSCGFQMDRDHAVTATFELLPSPPPPPTAPVEAEYQRGSDMARSAPKVTLSAVRARVSRGAKATLSVKAEPCSPGQRVRIERGGKTLATKELSISCAATFKLGVKSTSSFQATVLADETYLDATSNKLKIQVRRAR